MKKKFAGIFAVLAAVTLLAGCGDKGGNENNVSSGQTNEEQNTSQDSSVAIENDMPLSRMEVEKYVTLGDYSNMQLELAEMSEVTDESVERLMKEAYLGSVTAENGGIVDRAVAVGDTVVIDYEGKKDGVAFAGGTAQGANLTIGSHQFIDGFEDGLVGVMPGETVDLNLTFPEDYKNNVELAGQAVVFTVTVHFIRPTDIAVEDMQDEIIVSMGMEGVNTVETFRKSAYDYLYDLTLDKYLNTAQKTIWNGIMEGCVFQELPEEMMTKYRETIRTNIETSVAANNMTLEDYAGYYGMTGEELLDSYTEDYVRQNLAMQAIANAEGLNVSDEELQEELSSYAMMAGYESVEAFIGTNSLEDYRDYFMNEKVMNFLTEKYTGITE